MIINAPRITVFPRLPSEYQEVEWIESSGTQYLKSGIYQETGLIADVKFRITTLPVKAVSVVFGSRYSNSDSAFYVSVAKLSGAGAGGKSINIGCGTGSSSAEAFSEINPVIERDYTGHVEYNNNKINNVYYPYYESDVAERYPHCYELYIFARNVQNAPDNYFKGKIYSLTIYKADVCVANFVPCYRESDGEIGMYDIVNDVFYTNQGTGTFTKGANV